MVIFTLIVLAFGLLFVWVMTGESDRCPDTEDGKHEDMHSRNERGWHLTCVRCGRETPGIVAFKRSEQ